uniref:G-protein coupled receptors family 1 profile domain-containing protein n=1 Tax=Cavia porcellus TaxID=10141 RepID=H0VWP2_CAVPO
MVATKPWSLLPGTEFWNYSGSGVLGDELESCPSWELPYSYAYVPALLLLLTFVLPLAVTVFCYWRISRRLRKPPHVGRARRNSLRIIFAVVGTFVGSWLPLSALRAVFHLARLGALPLPCPLVLALRWGLTVATCLAFVHSCANPLIYLLLDRSFRARALQRVCAHAGRQVPRISSASSLSRDDDSVFWGRRQSPNTASASW